MSVFPTWWGLTVLEPTGGADWRGFPTGEGIDLGRTATDSDTFRFPHVERGLTISNRFSEEIYLSLPHVKRG